jgi:hypothetical protein
MTQKVYKQMFDVMKQRKGPYTGVDIPEFYSLNSSATATAGTVASLKAL